MKNTITKTLIFILILCHFNLLIGEACAFTKQFGNRHWPVAFILGTGLHFHDLFRPLSAPVNDHTPVASTVMLQSEPRAKLAETSSASAGTSSESPRAIAEASPQIPTANSSTLVMAEIQVDPAQKTAKTRTLRETRLRSGKKPGRLAPTQIDLIRLQTSNVQFDAQNRLFSFDATLTNISGQIVFTPLKTVIMNLRPGSARVLNADGGGDRSGAFFQYTNFVGADKLLRPNETSASRNWVFFNPELKQFSFVVSIEGELQRTIEPPAPIVTQPASPTNQLMIQVSGTADPNAQVEIFDGVDVTTATANANGAFSATVQLEPNRENHLFVTAINAHGRSAPTPVDVIHDNQPPILFVDVPVDNAEVFSATTTVTGRISDVLSGFMGLAVTVNGQPATVEVGIGTNGTFEQTNVSLALGANSIIVSATDGASNVTTKTVTVTRVAPTGISLALISGNNQSGQVNTDLPAPIVVRVTKSNGSPLADKIITFDVSRSDGRLSTTTPVTNGTMQVQVRADNNGEARVYWQLGSDAGRGNNRVSVTSLGVTGTIVFSASATPAPASKISVSTGDHQRAETGSPAPEALRVWMTDGVNGIANIPVTFTVTEGDGKLENGDGSVTINTDATGHAEVNLTLGPLGGYNFVEATFPGNAELPATFSIFGVARTSQPTSFVGTVLDNAQQPIEGATCVLRVNGVTLPSTLSDANGRFSFTNIPTSGSAHLFVDGLTATALNGQPIPPGSFPFLAYEPVIVPNAENSLSTPVLLPALDPANARTYDGTEDVELTVEGIDGLRMIVKAGSMRRADGSIPSPSDPAIISLNQVHFDDIPMSMPDGVGPPYAGTLQPAGATFDPPVQVIFPNISGLPPGATAAFLSFNHETSRFEIVGTGHISADGSTFMTDPGSGISVAGWHSPDGRPLPRGRGGNAGGPECPGGGSSRGMCGGGGCGIPPPAFSGQGENPRGQGSTSNGQRGNGGNSRDDLAMDPVYLFNGEFYFEVEDLHIKGRGMDFAWQRKYRSKLGPNTAMGNGWDFSFNISLQSEGENLHFNDGNTRRDLYLPQSDGKWSRGEFFRELAKNADQTHTLTFADREQWSFNAFDGSASAGKATSIVDRNSNRMTLHYDSRGRLIRITDTLDRDILVAYNANGLISSVTDFFGRVVQYEYYNGIEPGGNLGDLKSVTTPAVTGTPNANDFPNGKKTTYTYSTGFSDERLNHNLLTITDGRRNDPSDPTFGQGPYLVNVYASTTNQNDVNFDRLARQIWGGDTIDVTYIPLRPTSTNKAVVKTIVNDRVGNLQEYFYDIRNRLLLSREYTGRANPTLPTTETLNRPSGKLRPGDPDFFETRYEYNYDALLKRTIHPNGNITENVYESDLNPDAEQRSKGNLRVIRQLPGTHTPVGDQAEITEAFEYDTDFGGCCGFNFVTKRTDGRGNETLYEYDTRGNRTRIQHRLPTIIENFEYNTFGQMTARVHPDNGSNHRRRDELTYYDAGPQRGYLKDEIIDAPNLALATTYEYDVVGNIIRRIDPRRHDTQYVVNQLDQVLREISREVTEGSGLRYQRDTFYDANNNVIRRDVQNIDEQGVLQANTHFTTTYEYEILNHLTRMTQEIDPATTIITEYAYDNNRNRTLERFGEATNGHQPTNVMRTLYDERDLVFKEIHAAGDPNQSTTQFDYDRNRNLVTQCVGLENIPHVYQYVYDGYNREISMVDPMGNVMTYHYDANHNRVSVRHDGELVDVAGSAGNVRLRETMYVYDAMDRWIRQEAEFFDTATQTPIDDGEAITQFFYSDDSQIIRNVDDNNHESLISYDTANRRRVMTDDKSNTTTYAYDANSNVITITEVEKSDLGNPDETFATMIAYDNLDRLIKTTDNASNINEFGYDSRSNRTLHLDALRPSANQPGNKTKMDYDGLNRLVRTTRFLTSDGTGGGNPVDEIVTQQRLDDSNRLTAQIDDNGNTTTYTYDALNRRTAITYADGTSQTVSYDVHNNAIRKADANGSVVTFTYDLLNRPVNKSISRGTGVEGTTFENYQFDGLSRLVRAQDDDADVIRAYDSLPRVTRETLNGKATASLYDGVGNQLQCTYPGGRIITTTYDELERKKTVNDQNGPLASYDYIGPRRVELRDYANNTRTTYQYDGVRRMTRTTHTRDPLGTQTVIDDRTYTWDQMYNKTSCRDMRTGGLTYNYTYDSIYRLTRSVKTPTSGPAETIDHNLDGVGNRTSVTGGPNPGAYSMSPTLPEPADRQMNQYTTTSFDVRLYDKNGNLSRINNGLPSHRRFTYDYRNQMIGYVDVAAGINASYAYDAFGRRIRKMVSSGGATTTTRYFYHDLQVVEEQNASGVTEATYVYGLSIDEVLNMQRDVDNNGTAEDYFYHADQLYNVTAVTNATGVVMERYDYGDYGEPMFFDSIGNPVGEGQSVIGNPYLFTGRWYDHETAFFDYRTRYLDANSGRFIQRDVIGIWGDAYNLGNGYTYVSNNPMTTTDPEGKGPCNPEGDPEGNEQSPLCAEAARLGLDNGDAGGVICEPNGQRHPCAWRVSAFPEITICLLEHEREHIRDSNSECPPGCWGLDRLHGRRGSNPHRAECRAYGCQLRCLRQIRCDQYSGVARDNCTRERSLEIDGAMNHRGRFCGHDPSTYTGTIILR